MYHNGSEVYVLPSSNFNQRIVAIFGKKTKEKLVPVNEDTEIVKISGFVLKPEFAKRSRSEQFFFVNDRFIKSAYLNHAVTAAFEGLLKDRAYPGYFLALQVDPKTIDINIHPTKTEIKFDNEHDLYAIIRSAVKHSLGQFQIAPILDFQRDASMDTPYAHHQKNIAAPTIEVDRSFNPFANEIKTTSKGGGGATQNYQKKNTNSWESLYVGLESKMTKTLENTNTMEFESAEATGSFFEDDVLMQEQITLQIQNKYIISKIKNGMMVINQHRAHERILFEEFLQHITVNEAVSQQLLFPEIINVTPQEMICLQQIKEVLESTGFVFSKLENETVEISGVPVAIENDNVAIVIMDLLATATTENIEDNMHATLVAKSLAKNLAVKSGKKLNKQEQEDVVNRLFACKEPTISPTNKPIFITYSTTDFDKKLL